MPESDPMHGYTEAQLEAMHLIPNDDQWDRTILPLLYELVDAHGEMTAATDSPGYHPAKARWDELRVAAIPILEGAGIPVRGGLNLCVFSPTGDDDIRRDGPFTIFDFYTGLGVIPLWSIAMARETHEFVAECTRRGLITSARCLASDGSPLP